ncbi:GLutaRedoXin [Seminavis robusta]|uniref:GLutaRedoXin n=1 Tax=Seminavis robusta TaxID=568900 RepID=A0A9N8H486_9STRA|nr:GLutaRedoXin [Seminavis robusta]|eukprot:Sro5_g004420.1 GLutaRedoXin (150) ;mRNA; f:150811-151377
MAHLRATALAALLLLVQQSTAFLHAPRHTVPTRLYGDSDSDPTKVWYAGLADTVQNVLTNSPLNEGKKALAKAVLDAKGTRYHVVELDEVKDGRAIRAEMADVIGRTSVPAIWIGGEFIGGCNDGPKGGIVKLDESGELDVMLNAVGAI